MKELLTCIQIPCIQAQLRVYTFLISIRSLLFPYGLRVERQTAARSPRVARGPARPMYNSGYQHLTVNQFSVKFIDPNTGAHTNTVQNMRMTNIPKRRNKRDCGTHDLSQTTTNEFIQRQNFGNYPFENFSETYQESISYGPGLVQICLYFCFQIIQKESIFVKYLRVKHEKKPQFFNILDLWMIDVLLTLCFFVIFIINFDTLDSFEI